VISASADDRKMLFAALERFSAAIEKLSADEAYAAGIIGGVAVRALEGQADESVRRNPMATRMLAEKILQIDRDFAGELPGHQDAEDLFSYHLVEFDTETWNELVEMARRALETAQ
jgi:hypothetical protein